MRKRIDERISEAVHEIELARQARNHRPHRQERAKRRRERERTERRELERELNERRAVRTREHEFSSACRAVSGKKKQGKGREIVPTTEKRIRYERAQRSAVSLGEYYANLAAERELERQAKQYTENFELVTNLN